MENISVILLATGLIILAYIVYKLSMLITRVSSITIIHDNNVKLIITLNEDGTSSFEVSYSKKTIDLDKIMKKLPKNSSYQEFLELLPKDNSILFDYEINYISNQKEISKYQGTTNDIKEITKQITRLKKYH